MSPETPAATDRAEAAGAIRIAEALEGLHFGATARSNRLEEQVAAEVAGLEARLEKLETRLAAAHAASVETVGLLAGQLVAGLQEQVEAIEGRLQERYDRAMVQVDEQAARVERALRALREDLVGEVDRQTARLESALGASRAQVVAEVSKADGIRHDELLAKLTDAQAGMLEAVGGLASGQLVDKLLEDVVATGEVLDAELIDLKRLLNDQRTLGAVVPAAPVQEPPSDPGGGQAASGRRRRSGPEVGGSPS